MKKMIGIVGVAAAAMLAVSTAEAVECEGFNARTYGKAPTIQKSKDGATTYLIRSTGTVSITSPAGMAATNWQHCNGLWTVNADKSGSGFGTCYTVTPAGDQRSISWEGANAAGAPSSGTWAQVTGTGKYKSWANNKGTWKSGSRFGDGVRIGSWEGTCGE